MPRYDDEDDADYDYDPDDPETYPEGLYLDNGRDTVPCRHCKADIDEDAEQCPECGQYVTREDVPAGASKFWLILMVLALFAAAVWAAGK